MNTNYDQRMLSTLSIFEIYAYDISYDCWIETIYMSVKLPFISNYLLILIILTFRNSHHFCFFQFNNVNIINSIGNHYYALYQHFNQKMI